MSESTGSTFSYSPLEPASKTIRLLAFQAGGDERLTCSLKAYSLDDCPPFIALSYCWGSANLSREILLNGKPLRIRENVWSLLHQLHRFLQSGSGAGKGSYLDFPIVNCFWVDAVCINQQDVVERGRQVDMMGQIFSCSDLTIAWLGVASDDSDLALLALSSTAKFVRTQLQDAAKWERIKLGIRSLCRREYWGRMWVIQEFVLPNRVYILCGSQGIWSPCLRNADMYLNHTQPAGTASSNSISYTSAGGLYSKRQQWERKMVMSQASEPYSRPTIPLNELVDEFFFRECSDPRDRIYALLALIPDPDPGIERLSADYTISSERLYYRVLQFSRSSPHFRDIRTWSKFKEQLSYALDVQGPRLVDEAIKEATDREHALENNTLRQVKVMRPAQKAAFLDMVDLFFGASPHQLKHQNPEEEYRTLVDGLGPFIRREDPDLWSLFEYTLEVALGIHIEEQ